MIIIHHIIRMKLPDSAWFTESREYWNKIEPTVEGVMGGYENLAERDETDSFEFLSRNIPFNHRHLALDCGAGIGRVSDRVLLRIFDKVSILDCTRNFLDVAMQLIPKDRMHMVHHCRIQDMYPHDSEMGLYDLVWFQWVLCYANDVELIRILQVARQFVKPGGFVGIKENITTMESDAVIDSNDHSVIRTDLAFKDIFQKAGLSLVSISRQRHFPSSLYPVKMYLLVPL